MILWYFMNYLGHLYSYCIVISGSLLVCTTFSGAIWQQVPHVFSSYHRAVNQALGRCLRHRYDWGALILVDERYQRGSLSSGVQQNKYTKGLSKWVRNKIVHHPSYPMALSSLNQFARNMTANPPKKRFQSYNSPAGGERVVRRVSRGRRSLSRRKGVQYSDVCLLKCVSSDDHSPYNIGISFSSVASLLDSF